jgi:hypothetical protein
LNYSQEALERLTNLENYIKEFHQNREAQLITIINSQKETINLLIERSKQLEERNNALFDEVAALHKKVILLEYKNID